MDGVSFYDWDEVFYSCPSFFFFFLISPHVEDIILAGIYSLNLIL